MGRELIKNDSFLCEWIFKSVVIVVLMGGEKEREEREKRRRKRSRERSRRAGWGLRVEEKRTGQGRRGGK